MDKDKRVSISGAEPNYFEKRIVRMIAIALAFILGILFCVAFALDFEPDKALFKNGSVIAGIAFYGSLLCSAIVMILTFALVKKQINEESAFPKTDEYTDYYMLDNAFVRIFRICTSVLVLSQGAVSAIADAKAGKGAISVAFSLLLCVCLALYFVPELTERIGCLDGKLHVAFGSVSLIWFALGVIRTYLQRDFAFASSYIVLKQVCYVLLLIALVYEMRYHIDGQYARTRLAASCAAFILGFGFGLGRMIMLITVGQVSLSDTAGAITCFVLSLYFGVRIFFYEED